MEENNKRIARNSLMLYIRMFLSVLVGLYTSRVVLQTLGVEDYGTYGVVGGVVAMFSFINAAMSGATSRFLTYEMGRGDYKQLSDTFSSALIIHIGIALFIFVLSETLGLWFLYNKLVIPEGRMYAANVVYQCSILSMMIGVTQVPYNATIIAHEKMDVYAYVELLQVFLKLGIVYLLLVFNYDKLILYAILVLAVSIIIAFTYRIYSLRHFEESHFHWLWKPSILRPMLTFTGWSTMSECGYSFRVYGSNIVLNLFFGTVVNAAGNIATTVQSILLGFVSNVTTAVRPQIIKAYSVKDFNRMSSLVYSFVRINLFLAALITVPCIIETHYVLQLWLGSIPPFCVQFCRLLLFAIFITGVSQIVFIGIQATGDIRLISIIRNVLYVLTPFIIYFIYIHEVANPTYAYVVIVFLQMIACLSDAWILSRQIDNFSCLIIYRDYFISIIFLFLIGSLFYYTNQFFEENFVRFLMSTFCEWICIFFFFYFVLCNEKERVFMSNLVHSFLTRIKIK